MTEPPCGDDNLQDSSIRLPPQRPSAWVIIGLRTIAILTMSSLTINLLLPILRDYDDVEENTRVQFRVRRADEGFRSPNLYLWIPLSHDWYARWVDFEDELYQHIITGRACPTCERMEHHSYDVWNREPVLTNKTSRALYTSDGYYSEFGITLRKRFIDAVVANSTAVTRIANLHWTHPILYAVVDFLSHQTEAEEEIFNEHRMDEDAQHYASKRHLDALYSTLVHFVCEFVSVSEISANRDTSTNICQELLSNNSFVSSVVKRSPQQCACDDCDLCTCLRIRIPLTMLADEVRVTIRSEYFDQYIGKRERFFAFVNNPMYNTRSSNLLPSLDRLYETPYEDLDALRSEEVTLAYSLESSVIEERPQKLKACYDESSEAECQLACWMRRLESICGCLMHEYGWKTMTSSSLRVEVNDNSSTYCDSEEFFDCRARLAISPNPYDCATECMDACQSYKYQWEAISSMSTGNRSNNEFKLRIERRRQSYLEFTTKVKDSSEDLISQIGGIISFYLGLSGLSAIVFLGGITHTFKTYQRALCGSSANATFPGTVSEESPHDAQHERPESIRQLERTMEASIEKKKGILMDSDSKIAIRMNMVERSIDLLVERIIDAGKAFRDVQTMMERKKKMPAKAHPRCD